MTTFAPRSTDLPSGWRKWPIEVKLRHLALQRALRWRLQANPGQIPPRAGERIWYAQGGRGSGKTRSGAEYFAELLLTTPKNEWACVGPTFGDARDTMVEHQKSGLLKILGGEGNGVVTNWNRSAGELYLANGSVVYCDGADDGALRVQGKGLAGAWCDEIGLWKTTFTRRGEEKGGMQAWRESIRFAVRESPALIVCTGTPKGNKGVVKLLRAMKPGRVAFTYPSLDDNRHNNDPAVVAEWEEEYAGTRLGRQELGGEILEDVEGALWTLAELEATRLSVGDDDPREDPRLIPGSRCVIAVDPSASDGSQINDEAGILVGQTLPVSSDVLRALLAADPTLRPDVDHALILADRSDHYSPTGWATAAIEAYREFRADVIVAEKNNGGEMVRTVIHGIDPNVPVKLVWASKGKQPRAEPVSALYEQRRVHHRGGVDFSKLEAEQTSWVPGAPSPNRMDALVWVITDLLIPEAGADYSPPPLDPDGEDETLTGDLMDAQW